MTVCIVVPFVITVIVLAVTLSPGDSADTLTPSTLPDPVNITVLTYNVAGLPQELSSVTPEVNMPLISPLLNAFDLVLVQEDFAYQTELRASATHAYVTSVQPASLAEPTDGLSRFSRHVFSNHTRVTWTQCHGLLDSGSDCLAPKGYSVAQHTMAPGYTVDVYNIHMDAADRPNDIAARTAQVQQLVDAIQSISADHAVIVAGDTNIRPDTFNLESLVAGANLTDTCVELSCSAAPDWVAFGLIDRVFYRNSERMTLTPSRWRQEALLFRNETGSPLSDHPAVAVDFLWEALI